MTPMDFAVAMLLVGVVDELRTTSDTDDKLQGR